MRNERIMKILNLSVIIRKKIKHFVKKTFRNILPIFDNLLPYEKAFSSNELICTKIRSRLLDESLDMSCFF